jgi:hypothetical protein
MTTDWTELTAVATAGAALAAFTTAVVSWRVGIRQVQASIVANGVNLATQIRAHVHSSDFRSARHRAAAALLEGRFSLDVVYVLDELETVGLLVRRNVLDRQIVWTMLSSLVVNYVAAAQAHIDEDRRKNPTLWSNLLYLYDQMLEVERAEGGTDVNPRATYRAYLEQEVREMAADGAAGGTDDPVEAAPTGRM